MRTTIARDIIDIAAAYDHSGRTSQPIKIYASASTLQKCVRNAVSGFLKIKNAGGGNRFFTVSTPLSC